MTTFTKANSIGLFYDEDAVGAGDRGLLRRNMEMSVIADSPTAESRTASGMNHGSVIRSLGSTADHDPRLSKTPDGCGVHPSPGSSSTPPTVRIPDPNLMA